MSQEFPPQKKKNAIVSGSERISIGAEYDDGEAHVWVQDQPPWEDFTVNIDEEAKRKPATPEQERDMDQRLVELGEVFAGSNLDWHLDGALNISLMAGKYIGNHKDVDISIGKNELEGLEVQLFKNGYGLFLSSTNRETGERTLRRVGYQVFEDSEDEHMLIAAIDERGKLRRDKALNFVDVHVVARNAAGQAIGNEHVGVAIPEKWAQPHPIDFRGQQINLSHPGKVLYFKLQQTRNYDVTDIDRLVETGRLTVEDVDDVSRIMEEEFSANIQKAKTIFAPIVEKITPQMTVEEIAELFLSREEFHRGGDEVRQNFILLGQHIVDSGDRSVDGVLVKAVMLFGVEEKNNEKRQRVATIRKTVEAQIALGSVRDRLIKK